MRKIISRLKIFHLSNRTITLLFATLLITLSTQIAPRADTSQFLLSGDDLKDLGSLAVKLQDTRAVISQHIAPQLSAETQQLLGEYDGISSPSPELRKALLDDLNRLLQVGPLHDAESFADIELSKRTQEFLAQNPQRGDSLIHLNRLLLTDAYPYELVSSSEKQKPDDSTGIERCRENLRQIKLALENHRAEEDRDPQWLSELSPEYLKKNVLLCPADTTVGVPGVLTEGGSDPTLPCSYLYQFRPEQKTGQEFLLEIEGDMLPVVRCEHHLLNLSVSGKIYRNGPQRKIYNNSTVKTISIQTNSSSDLPEEVRKQIEDQPLKGGNNQVNRTVLQIKTSDDPQAKLKEQFGEAFLESPEGQALLKQLTTASIDREKFAFLLGKPMPDITLTTLSGKPVKLETLHGKFALVNLFLTDSTPSGAKLKQLEKLLANYDATQLQAVGVSMDDSAKAIAAFKEKHQLSMPVWMDKNDQMQTFLNIQSLLNRDASEPQTELITLLLNQELVVKDVFIDLEPEDLSQRVNKLLDSKK
ncbi:TlpA family protein disulfide reductase [Candidatus Poribacteria bacterium]|nr:TlpA family protein disulfide reductase [Candidatus Poribacteria bacterium]MYH79622.1 TlpA family protein disulfide reductase [Candidatus Poribacteria bacterium]MYK95978.1 TlpA family protein disulfide reductase [Candidatus Poribacteria bacterium]